MPINILMPALSPTMEEGTLAKWLVKEGDRVTSGDVIAEIETDKATMEVEAVDEGVVGKILVSGGTGGVRVNALIAVLLEDGEDADAVAVGAAQPGGDIPRPPDAAFSPTVQVSGSATAAATGAAGTRIFASPLAKRIARDAGIDLTMVTGTGPHGRIVRRDVEAVKDGSAPRAVSVENPAQPHTPKAATLPAGMADDAILQLFEAGTYEVEPHDSMRKTIARRLTEAKATVPHFYLSIDCELDALLDLRARLNASAPEKDGKPAFKISVNDMVIKAHALALQAVPDANASWTDSGMLKHKHSDIGVAVAIPGGLITPIVRRAEQKTLSTISGEMKDFAGRARERKLLPHEFQGGTTAISNLGMFGISDFCAVINPPHATILAVGAGQKRPIVRDSAVAMATMMKVTLSTDHRAVDGALGAALLAAFRQFIEHPMGMLV